MSMLPPASSTDLQLLVDLIRQQIGMDYSDGRSNILMDKLSPLVVERGMTSYLDYFYLLKFSPDAESEWRRVESVLAVNETYFWREHDQMQITADTVLPLLQKERPGLPVRIWNAGCATGEEPYSLAITLLESGLVDHIPFKIVATDMNATAIALARSAVYRARSLRNLPLGLKERYFTPTQGGQFRLLDSVRSLVQFSRLNLVDEKEDHPYPSCDIIFCRNVFIYFNDATIQRVAQGFCNCLSDPGFLFLGASESLFRLNTAFELTELSGAFCYRKIADCSSQK